MRLSHSKIRIAALCLSMLGSASAKPAFQTLLFNPKWYRTFDSASSVIPAEGTLLYAWTYADPEKRADSFFVGIDTLWGLPQDQGGDTASDWDLQVCPDEICMNGLKAGIHGANGAYPFGDTVFSTEHHFQYFPAIDPAFNFTAPARSIFGALMYCKSRSTGVSDTVFAFGAWKLKWDPAHLPPVKPVDGYLPRFADFAVSGDTVRYLKAGSGVARRLPQRNKPAERPGIKDWIWTAAAVGSGSPHSGTEGGMRDARGRLLRPPLKQAAGIRPQPR